MPTLDPDLDRLVQAQIARGRFRTPGDVVRAGLALLEEQEAGLADHLAKLKRQINEAFDDPAPGLPLADVFEDLEALHRADMRDTGERVGGRGA